MKAVFLIFSLVEWLRKKMKEVLHLSIVGSVSLNTYREFGCAKKEKEKKKGSFIEYLDEQCPTC